MNNTPLLSISCTTYNHKNYINDAIEGFLMQKTTFPIEILINDDTSTDGTAAIVKKYETKYPGIIKPIYQRENQYSQGRAISTVYQFPRARGKYIAFCEGDDYWTDPYKLQKQVDFLEANPEYGMVHTNNDVLYQKSGKIEKKVKNNKGFENFNNTFFGILTGDYEIATCTVVVKRELLFESRDNDIILEQKNLQGDLPRWLSIAQASKIKYINDSTAVYRKNFGSVRRSGEKNKQIEFQESSKRIRMQFAKKYMVPHYILERVEDMYYSVMITKGYHFKRKDLVIDSYKRIHKKNINIILKYISVRFGTFRYIVKIMRYLRKPLLKFMVILKRERV